MVWLAIITCVPGHTKSQIYKWQLLEMAKVSFLINLRKFKKVYLKSTILCVTVYAQCKGKSKID